MSDAFIRSALIGVGRDEGATPLSGTPIDALVVAEGLGREREFLLRAGARDVYLRAGLIPAKSVAPPECASPETLATCSPRLADAIADILSENDQELLRVTATALHRAGLHLPHRILPEVLGQREKKTQSAFAPVLGERGRWLARLNPAWSWALGATDQSDVNEQWEEGNGMQRVEALRAIRVTDPAGGRERLAAVWVKEKAEQRVALIGAIATSLAPEDEEFLERALDDRSVNVKAAAAELLARLPASSFVARMKVRADAALRLPAPAEPTSVWSKVKSIGFMKSVQKLVIDPPQELDVAATRDVIPSRTPQGVGTRAYALTQIIGAIPPSTWTGRFSMTPEQLLAAATESDWSAALIEGWTLAAIRHRDATWARAVFGSVSRSAVTLTNEQKIELASTLPAGDLIELVESINAAAAGTWPLASLLDILPRPWPDDFSERWLRRMHHAASRGGDSAESVLLASTAEIAARSIPESLFDIALIGWEIADDSWQRNIWERSIHRLTQTVTVRKLIAEETIS